MFLSPGGNMMTTTPPRHNPPKTVYVMGHWRHRPYDHTAAAAARGGDGKSGSKKKWATEPVE